MVFGKSEIPFPPTHLTPGSCQAVRIEAALSRPLERHAITPEWREQNERRQLAYEVERRRHRKEIGIVDTK